MKRQQKSTTIVDVFYLECLINKLIRSNKNNSIHPQTLQHQLDTQLNITNKSTFYKHNPILIENKIQASSLYQKKSLHTYSRPFSDSQNRKFHQINIEDQFKSSQRNNLQKQIKNQIMFSRLQQNKQENRDKKQQLDIINPLKVSKKPIKIFSIHLKSSFKQVTNTSRLNTGLNLSNQRNFSPIRIMTERPNADINGWQTAEDAEWI